MLSLTRGANPLPLVDGKASIFQKTRIRKYTFQWGVCAALLPLR